MIDRLSILLTFILVSFSALSYSQFSITGVVKNEQGERLDFATVFLINTDYATSTNQQGEFLLENVPEGTYQLKVTYVGYEPYQTTIFLEDNMEYDVIMSGSIYQLNKIYINATRASKEAPIAEQTMQKDEIEDNTLTQDVPYALKWMQGVTVTSDAGAGVGYTGIRVRGSEASRTNVTINGVPLNDSESQQVFWVDLPDFMASTQDVQIQRGVGVSTNGTSAFGATINLNTQKTNVLPYIEIGSAIGSYNTRKISAQGGTGLMNGKYSIDARYSLINSDGYIDRATSRLNSFFLSAARVSEKSSLRLNIMSGNETTYQSWFGLPIQYLDSIRTHNIAGTDYQTKEGEPHPNEVDRYRQTHYQLVFNKGIGEYSKINLTGHLTRGQGYYENYYVDENFQDFNVDKDTIGDIIQRKWLNNNFFGLIYSYQYDNDKINFTYGGAGNMYIGDHLGQIPWTEFTDSLSIQSYFNTARKNELNNFVRFSANWNNIYPFVDMQVRYVNYQFEGYNNDGTLGEQVDNLFFFNPKIGASYIPNSKHKVFAFFGIANREPSRDEYVESTSNSRPSHETLYDTEVGYQLSTQKIGVNLTLYNMQYRNQLVPTGQLNDVGEPVRVNVDNSYRRGVEIGLQIRPIQSLQLQYQGALSQNKIEQFNEYIYDWYLPEFEEVVTHANTDIAFSPSQIHSIRLRYDWNINENQNLAAIVSQKWISEQYLDNTGRDASLMPAFNYTDFQLVYDIQFWRVKNLSLNFLINNLLNNKYYSNGWIYRFRATGDNPVTYDPYAQREGDNLFHEKGVYPQALRNYTLGLKIKF